MTKKNNNFKKLIIKYLIFLLILATIFLIYVRSTLVQYEKSFITNYITTFTEDFQKAAKRGKISKYINTKELNISSFETSKLNYKKAFKQAAKDTNFTCQKSSKSTDANSPIYDIYSNDKPIATVYLNKKKTVQRLGLFSYPIWEISKVETFNNKGLYYYDIYALDSFKVKVNGIELSSANLVDEVENDAFSIINNYTQMPKINKYQIDNLLTEPDIKIYNSKGQEITPNKKTSNTIEALSTKSTNSIEEALNELENNNIDVLDIAEKWSLFLTDDLSGGTNGFTTLKPYLIKDSYTYNMAYQWATSIDITFVSSHSLKNPTFTNESIQDIIIYNENAFSCTVYLEKNMKLSNGLDRVDKMHEKLYFVFCDDTNDSIDNPSWKLVKMEAITK